MGFGKVFRAGGEWGMIVERAITHAGRFVRNLPEMSPP